MMKISRKKVGLFITIIGCGLMLYHALSQNEAEDYQPENEYEVLYDVEYYAPHSTMHHIVPIGDDQPVSRAMAAKMLSLIFESSAEIHSAAHTHPFTDIDPNSWYAPYINAAYRLGIMRGGEGRFMPSAPLTIGQAQILMRTVDQANAPSFANIPDPDVAITYALWVDLYKQLLEGKSGDKTIYEAFQISAFNIIILATSVNSPLPHGRLVSHRGPLGHAGLTMDSYIDKELRVLVKDREIIALDGLISDSPILRNAYIVEVGREGVTIFAGGAERFYVGDAPNLRPGDIADLHIYNGSALAVMQVNETVSGILLRAGEMIEIKGVGLFPVCPNFQAYDNIDGPTRTRNLINFIVGTYQSFHLREDGHIGAGIITREQFPENIRVVIGTSNFEGLIHSSVSITGTGNFWITAGDRNGERLAELTAGQRFTISDIENSNLLGHPRLFFHTEPGESLQLISLGRNWPQNVSPRYRGVIEVAQEFSFSQRGYSIVNSLSLEEYLYAVVPSEMPSAYGLEASKVQAVTARSFAVGQIVANRFHALGGNIDDSVMSQVYNNVPENEISIEAVESTRGLVLWYGDSIVQANFFSTSAGMTANAGEVWAFGGQFPSYTPSFLSARSQLPGRTADSSDFPDLTREANATAFFRNLEIDAYDSHSPWFRWQTEMTLSEIGEAVNVGELRDMQVLRRGEGGNIMALQFIGSEGIQIVTTELDIRNTLRPSLIRRHDGSTLLNLNMMPSAFFSFQIEEGVVTFHGGGHGHGVGMSQNGVHGMVERGYSFDEILLHFYPGVVLYGF